MIGPYDIELCGKYDSKFYFRFSTGDKAVLKDSLSKKDLAMLLKIGTEDAKVFRDECWLKSSDLKEWTSLEERNFWKD